MTDETPRLAQQRAKRMLRDLQAGPFVVLAFPEGDDDNLRIYASGLSPRKMQLIEAFVERVINNEEEANANTE